MKAQVFKQNLVRLLILAGLCVLAAMVIVTQVHAQCGDNPPDSSCYQCHELEQADPVYGRGEWHDIHALKDCCWNCHGGNSQTLDKDLAHQDMQANPLMDVRTDCYPCHPADYSDRADRFAALLGIEPGGIEPPSEPVADNVLRIEHPMIILQQPEPPATSNFFFYLGPMLAVVLILTVAIVAWRLSQQAG